MGKKRTGLICCLTFSISILARDKSGAGFKKAVNNTVFVSLKGMGPFSKKIDLNTWIHKNV
jgi:hypothetical protein